MDIGDFFQLFFGLLTVLISLILLVLKWSKIKALFPSRERLQPLLPTQYTFPAATHPMHADSSINQFFLWQARWIGAWMRRFEADVRRQLDTAQDTVGQDLAIGDQRLRLMPAEEEQRDEEED